MDQFNKLTNQQKILILLLSGVFVYLYFGYLLNPLNKKVTQIKGEIAQKERRVIDARNKARKKEQLEAELQASREELELAEKKLPRAKEIPHLIRNITKTGKKYAIDITNLSPRAPVSHQYFNEYHYGMNINTDYHNLGKFFTDICQLERILKTKDVSINTKSSSEDDLSNIRVSFTLVTYAYLE